MRTVTARHALVVLGLAVAVRLPFLHAASLWYDEVTVGLTGLAVLRGELPVYFFGQPFMGALGDAYLTAPALLILGPSARALKLVALLLALAWIGLVVRFAWDAFGPRAALYTALVVAIPLATCSTGLTRRGRTTACAWCWGLSPCSWRCACR